VTLEHAHEPLVRALAAFASDVPHDVLERACRALELLEAGAPKAQWVAAMAELPQPDLRARAVALVEDFIAGASQAGPAGLSWALRSAEAASRAERARQALELVWTGPAPAGSTLRRTDQALLEVINRAQKSLLIVTYAAYDVAEVREALLAAEARGVRLAFILESKEESGGKVTFDAAIALGPLAGRAAIYVWPLEQRPRDHQGRPGALHAKCALADGSLLFVSSANLTGFALRLNMELGLLIDGGDLPACVAAHFDALLAEKVLARGEPSKNSTP
jgi:phosphatidylserine/phosphatidylglycerophosphate/cardiolipin synthase-like enzyme